MLRLRAQVVRAWLAGGIRLPGFLSVPCAVFGDFINFPEVFPRVVLEEEPINEAKVVKVLVKEAEEEIEMEEVAKMEVEDRGIEPTPDVADGVETEGVTAAPRSSKQM